MRPGPTITVVHHNLPFINTSQTQPLLIEDYLLSSHVQGSLNVDMGIEAPVLPCAQATHIVRFEVRNLLYELREAFRVWSVKLRHRPETKTAQLLEIMPGHSEDAARFAKDVVIGGALVIGGMAYDSSDSAVEGEEVGAAFGFNGI